MKISDKNSKLGKIPNISLVPVKDCGNCDSCKTDCYAVKSYRQYPNVRKAWQENSKAFRADPFAAIPEILAYLKKKNPRFFRIHVSGDFLNQDHVEAWALIAKECPTTRFLAFTKMFGLDYDVMPDNVEIVFSMFPTIEEIPQGNIKSIRYAWVDQDKAGNIETRIPADAIECPGICDVCGMCWNLSKIGHDVYFHSH